MRYTSRSRRANDTWLLKSANKLKKTALARKMSVASSSPARRRTTTGAAATAASRSASSAAAKKPKTDCTSGISMTSSRGGASQRASGGSTATAPESGAPELLHGCCLAARRGRWTRCTRWGGESAKASAAVCIGGSGAAAERSDTCAELVVVEETAAKGRASCQPQARQLLRSVKTETPQRGQSIVWFFRWRCGARSGSDTSKSSRRGQCLPA